MTVTLSPEEIGMLIEAIDSHRYWQLSEHHYRSDATVIEPGSDDPELIDELKRYEELAARLEQISQTSSSST